jgi:outer membrane protein TolC
MEDLSQSLINDTTKLGDIISYAEQPLHELINMGQMSIMPIISGLENAEDASNALYDVAKGNLYGKPDFALQISLGYSGPRLPFIETDWYGQDDYTFNVSIGMKSTLFDGKKAVTEAKKALSEILIQKAKTLDGKQKIASEIKKYRNEILTYQQLISILDQKLSILKEKTLILETEVRLGSTNEATLLSHRLAYIQELIKKEQHLLKMKIAYFSLLHITQPYE